MKRIRFLAMLFGTLGLLGGLQSTSLRAQSTAGEAGKYSKAELKGWLEAETQRLLFAENAYKNCLNKLQGIEVQLAENQKLVQESEAALMKSNLSAQAFPEVLVMLQTMRVQLKVDLAGLRARQKAISQAQEEASSNPAELEMAHRTLNIAEKMMEIATKRFEQTEKAHQSGLAPQSELWAAEEAMQQATFNLTKARFEVESSFQAPKIGPPQSLFELAEKEARLEEVEKILAEMVEIRGQAKTISQADSVVERLTGELAALREKSELLAQQRIEQKLKVDEIRELLEKFPKTIDDQ